MICTYELISSISLAQYIIKREVLLDIEGDSISIKLLISFMVEGYRTDNEILYADLLNENAPMYTKTHWCRWNLTSVSIFLKWAPTSRFIPQYRYPVYDVAEAR